MDPQQLLANELAADRGRQLATEATLGRSRRPEVSRATPRTSLRERLAGIADRRTWSIRTRSHLEVLVDEQVVPERRGRDRPRQRLVPSGR